jgi:DNA-binding transcriptional MerR regulator
MNDILSLSEASKMSGKSLATVRRWAKEGLVIAEKNRSGRWQIPTHQFRVYLAQDVSLHEPSMDKHNEGQSFKVEASQMLYEALHRERKINDDLRSQVKEKDGELLKLTYEMKSMLEGKYGGLLSRWIRS